MNSNSDLSKPAFAPQPMINADQRRRVSGEPESEVLQAVLDRAGITAWDVLLVGDGSGNEWDKACGWAGVLIDRETRGRRLDWGAMNPGSINFAETMPYLQLINWYDQHGGGKERLRQYGFVRVHIITDSQVIARWGTASAGSGDLPRNHIVMWAGLRELRRLGYQFTFHWANRSESLLNWMADLVAGMARRELLRLLDKFDVGDVISQRAAAAIQGLYFANPLTGEPINIYHLNHDGE
jgi:hypothetical protein